MRLYNKKPSYGFKINIIFPNHFKNRPRDFQKIVVEKKTDYRNKGFDSWNHLVSMLSVILPKHFSSGHFNRLPVGATGNPESFRDKNSTFKSSMLLEWKTDADLFKDVYFKLLEQLGQHTKERRIKLKIKVPVYLLDSTLISLCLSLFD